MTTNPKDKQKEYNHKWYSKHKVKHRETVRLYALNNPEKVRKRKHLYYLKNKGKFKGKKMFIKREAKG